MIRVPNLSLDDVNEFIIDYFPTSWGHAVDR